MCHAYLKVCHSAETLAIQFIFKTLQANLKIISLALYLSEVDNQIQKKGTADSAAPFLKIMKRPELRGDCLFNHVFISKGFSHDQIIDRKDLVDIEDDYESIIEVPHPLDEFGV